MGIEALPKISLNVTNGVLVVSIQVELHDETVEILQKHILGRIHESHLTGVLIDVSGVDIIDSFILRMLMDTAKMAKLLGAKTVFTGIKPEIVASLVDFGNISEGIQVVLNIDEGLRRLQK